MQDKHREKLDNRLTPIHLYKLTPKTNCGECGFASCLAFATQVIVGQGDLDACPYLDLSLLEPFRDHLESQHQSGIGLKREGFEKALHHLRGEIKKWNLENLAESLGASFVLKEGEPALELTYFGNPVIVTAGDIVSSLGKEINPWEKIFLYNYVIGGAVECSGVWVGMESFPNSVSKIKSLKAHCEGRLAQSFASKFSALPPITASLGRDVTSDHENVDFAAEFQILPRLPIRILWWDEVPSEGFEAKTKFLFDSRALETLDLESLLFACEQLTGRLLDALQTL